MMCGLRRTSRAQLQLTAGALLRLRVWLCKMRKAWMHATRMVSGRCLAHAAESGKARRGGAQPNAQRMPRAAHLRPAHIVQSMPAHADTWNWGEEPAA